MLDPELLREPCLQTHCASPWAARASLCGPTIDWTGRVYSISMISIYAQRRMVASCSIETSGAIAGLLQFVVW